MSNSSFNINRIFEIRQPDEFNDLALQIFHHQYKNNAIYHQFVNYLKTDIQAIQHYQQIPFLPIEFFKSQRIYCSDQEHELEFTSSGTTGTNTSHHFVARAGLYEQSFIRAFELFFGETSQFEMLALLPSYMERSGSSLIYMVKHLMQLSGGDANNWFLYNHKDLFQRLNEYKKQGRKVILFGVSFALLDFLDEYQINFPELIIIETGGMKGRKKEITRQELHDQISAGFGVKNVFSEYGMTELLSQAYSMKQMQYSCPPWMKVLIRDVNDPLSLVSPGKSGGINVIDLANYHSCSFIATKDLGILNPDDSFQIIGRFDQSDVRGCNLMVAD